MPANLMDHLQEAGYEPPDFSDEWYDLVVSGVGTVRVIVSDDVYVYAFDQYMTLVWDAKFSAGAPDAAIVPVIEAAEWQLAAKRGGPVTPAQAARA